MPVAADQAVAQHVRRHVADVVDRDVVAAAEPRLSLRGAEQVDRRARARAELEAGVLTRAPHDRDDVAARPRSGTVGQVEVGPGLVEPDDAEQRLDLAEHVRRDAGVREPEHLDLALGVGVVEDDLEEEAVELRLGQREDALVLERVLGRDHEERVGELVRLPLDRDGALLHRLEQRRLRAGRGAVDLVGEEDVREDDARHEDLLAHLDRVDGR